MQPYTTRLLDPPMEMMSFSYTFCKVYFSFPFLHNIYEPLKQAIIRHDIKKNTPSPNHLHSISKTCNFHTRTLVEIAHLVSFKENPPDNISYKSLPTQAQTIAMAIHVHAQELLTPMSKVSRSTLTQRRKTTKQIATNNNDS